jgi:hypothetical protein
MILDLFIDAEMVAMAEFGHEWIYAIPCLFSRVAARAGKTGTATRQRARR